MNTEVARMSSESPVIRCWTSGPCKAVLDEGGFTFDTAGTPMDQEWYCSLEQLAASAEVLRQTWPEAVLVEFFAEATRLKPGIPPLPPPQAKPPAAPRPHTRRRRAPKTVKAAPQLPTHPRGFGDDALEGLCARVIAAARTLDPAFPVSLGPLVQQTCDLDERAERRSLRAGMASHGVTVVVVSEMQDGIGGPVAHPVSASFRVVGLAAGNTLCGTWDGLTVVASAEGRPQACAQALEVLLGRP